MESSVVLYWSELFENKGFLVKRIMLIDGILEKNPPDRKPNPNPNLTLTLTLYVGGGGFRGFSDTIDGCYIAIVKKRSIFLVLNTYLNNNTEGQSEEESFRVKTKKQRSKSLSKLIKPFRQYAMLATIIFLYFWYLFTLKMNDT